jgi:hypothetical protein
MATALIADAKVTREVEFMNNQRRMVVHLVTITREGVYMREKGTRKSYGPCSWSRVCWEATKATDGMPSIPDPAKRRDGSNRR